MIPHRGRDMQELLSRVARPLQRLFRTDRQVIIGSCSATAFMEMAVRCGIRHRVLSLVGGAFGERFAAIAAACGREVMKLSVPPGDTVDPEMLHDALKRSEVDAVTLVHSETSTGALAPLSDLAGVVREFDDVMLLVDGVTSVAGLPVETDLWGLDFVLTGSQKALALPPGLALAAASERMLERAGSVGERGAYLDVLAYDNAFRASQPTNTPAISLLYALDVQLRRIEDEGGIEARWKRHGDMQKAVEAWVERDEIRGKLEFLPAQGKRSWTVSCLKVLDRGGREIVNQLRDRGWIIGTGYGPLKESSIRIGHMGDHTLEELQSLLAAIDEIIA